MRYLADLLTMTRFVLATVLFVWAFTSGSAEGAFIIFIVAELTDVFDGTCARKWPFPKNRTPHYRKYSALFDMVSDALLAAAQLAFLVLRVNWVAGIVILCFYTVICGVIELVVYGKFFGHPDNCTDGSLARRNFPLAKNLILTRRYLYVTALVVSAILTLFATGWPEIAKYALLGSGCIMLIFVWFFLEQRRHNISRDATNIEKALTKKAHKEKNK